jgi:hypothetical protein
VTFTVVGDAVGEYSVEVNGQTCQYTVAVLPPLPEPTGSVIEQEQNRWPLIGGIAAAVLVLAVFIYLWRRRGRFEKE